MAARTKQSVRKQKTGGKAPRSQLGTRAARKTKNHTETVLSVPVIPLSSDEETDEDLADAKTEWYMHKLRYQPKVNLRGADATVANIRKRVGVDEDGNRLEYLVHYKLVGRKRTRRDCAYHYHSVEELVAGCKTAASAAQMQGTLEIANQQAAMSDHRWIKVDGARHDSTDDLPVVSGKSVEGWSFPVFQQADCFCAANALRNIGVENDLRGLCDLPSAVDALKCKTLYFDRVQHDKVTPKGKYVISLAGHCVSLHNGWYLDTDPCNPLPKRSLVELNFPEEQLQGSKCYRVVVRS